MRRALVTGASGMIGGRLVKRLVAEEVEVRAFVRAGTDTRRLAAAAVELVEGDLTAPEDAARAVAGVDCVFHLAAYVRTGSPFGDRRDDPERYRHENVAPTEALLEAAARADVGRFVFTSSASVYDSQTSSPIGEDAPLRPASSYGESKLLAEERVRAWGDELDAAIVRPSLVYGDGDRNFLPAALELSRLPILPLADGGRHLIDIVHCADVVDLMWRAGALPQAAGRVYNAGAGTPVSLRRLVEAVAAALGVRVRTCSVPQSLLRLASPVAQRYVGTVSPRSIQLVSATGLDLILGDVYFDVSRAKRELGWAPAVELQDGLATAVRDLAPLGL